MLLLMQLVKTGAWRRLAWQRIGLEDIIVIGVFRQVLEAEVMLWEEETEDDSYSVCLIHLRPIKFHLMKVSLGSQMRTR